MAEKYQKVIVNDDDGQETIEDVEIEAVVKSHPLYKEVLTETIERRGVIKQLKQALEEKPETPPETPPVAVDTDALYKRVLEQVRVELQGELTQKIKKDTEVSSLLTKYRLPDEAKGILEDLWDLDPVKADDRAQKLGKISKSFDPVVTGGDGADPLDVVLTNLDRKLFGEG